MQTVKNEITNTCKCYLDILVLINKFNQTVANSINHPDSVFSSIVMWITGESSVYVNGFEYIPNYVTDLSSRIYDAF